MAAHGAEATGFAATHPTGFATPQSTGFATPQSTGFATPQSTGFATPQRPLPAPEGGKQRTPSGESGYVIMSPGVSGQYYLSFTQVGFGSSVRSLFWEILRLWMDSAGTCLHTF
jgi:hypothetical protein